MPSHDLPHDLERLYGGALGFEAPCLYANFVSSLDGVVALKGLEHSSNLISGRSEVRHGPAPSVRRRALIGAGTLRAYPIRSGRPRTSIRKRPPHSLNFEIVKGSEGIVTVR